MGDSGQYVDFTLPSLPNCSLEIHGKKFLLFMSMAPVATKSVSHWRYGIEYWLIFLWLLCLPLWSAASRHHYGNGRNSARPRRFDNHQYLMLGPAWNIPPVHARIYIAPCGTTSAYADRSLLTDDLVAEKSALFQKSGIAFSSLLHLQYGVVEHQCGELLVSSAAACQSVAW